MHVETRLFIADLTHLDCAFFDPEAGLTGESWRVDAELGGELGADGMLCDFGVIKSTLKQALDEEVDHRLLLARDQATDLAEAGGQCETVLRSTAGEQYRYRAPRQAYALFDLPALEGDAFVGALADLLLHRLPGNISQLQLWLSPAHDQGPYQYCHGLRQHAGNCQRMAHGHRARLEIAVDGTRVEVLEQQWQAHFQGRYIGAAGHLQTRGERHRYAYAASQGEFELELPAARSYVLDAEPTVESITAHMAREIAAAHPGHEVACRAFEGIGKGAISRCRV